MTTVHYCEALVAINHPMGRELYSPCGTRPAELHHKLTRARGGLILDAVGESYHQMYLCRVHHGVAHDEGHAFENGLLIAGSVTTENGRPVYVGSDEYLSEKYGATHEPRLVSRGEVS